jgi:hypothetical protein
MYFELTVSAQGSSQLPLSSESMNSIADVGHADSQAGAPPHRLHLLAVSVIGNV